MHPKVLGLAFGGLIASVEGYSDDKGIGRKAKKR